MDHAGGEVLGRAMGEASGPVGGEFVGPLVQEFYSMDRELVLASDPVLAGISNMLSRSPLVPYVDVWRRELADYEDQQLAAWVLHAIVNGLMLGSSLEPAPGVGVLPNNKSALSRPDVVDGWLDAELPMRRLAGPYDECPFPAEGCFVFPIGLTEKSTPVGEAQRYRTTSDHAQGRVNSTIAEGTARIKYISLHEVARAWGSRHALSPNGLWGFVIDIQDAYRILAMAPQELHKCVFRWRGKWYVDGFLSFGVATGPILFDSLARLLQWIVEKTLGITVYRILDDSAVVAESYEEALALQVRILEIYAMLGVPVQMRKLLMPDQSFKFMGIMWLLGKGVGRASLPLDKWGKMKSTVGALVQRASVRREELEKLCGFLNWCSFVVSHGRAFLRSFYDLLRGFKRTRRGPRGPWIRLSARAKADLKWWFQVANAVPALSIALALFCDPLFSVLVHTDASGWGFGGWNSSGDWFAGEWPWDLGLEADGSSTAFIELCAVLVAVRLFAGDWEGRVVQVMCDNMAGVQAWASRSSGKARVMEVIREIALELIKWRVGDLRLVWLSTTANSVADFLTRSQDPVRELRGEAARVLRRRWPVPASIFSGVHL